MAKELFIQYWKRLNVLIHHFGFSETVADELATISDLCLPIDLKINLGIY
jgi:hypothetical protein